MKSPGHPPPPVPPAGRGTTDPNYQKLVWAPHDTEVWANAEILQEKGEMRRVRFAVVGAANSRRQEKEVPFASCLGINPSAVDDMSSLHYMHEPGILFNLKDRYLRQQIYTYMGAAMIALNPFEQISQPPIELYSKLGTTAPPHPYAIAENAYRNLNVLKRNQSVVISGESGSGKTETAKIIVKYLADRNLALDNQSGERVSQGDQLYEQLQGLSPILESFGNAKTTRNSNSSRFGKFMKLNFQLTTLMNSGSSSRAKKSYRMELMGSQIETYLLEKSRVVHQNESEQNFHIFYSLLKHPPVGLESYLTNQQRGTPMHFRIARKPLDTPEGYYLDEAHYLAAVEHALRVLGMSTDQINEIWRILIALLYLGNITFQEKDTLEGSVTTISEVLSKVDEPTLGANVGWSSWKYLSTAAELLGIREGDLQELLIARQLETRNESFRVPLTVREAKFTCDAVCKAIYEALFGSLVIAMNCVIDTSAGVADEDKHFIGVLDIFGFESFAKNGFEQLLINFANEALQNTFNIQIFEKEKLLFEEEKIEINIGECPSNVECVQLISLKGESIFGKLDSISRQPNPSDGRFCEELHKSFAKKNKYFGAVHRKDMAHLFVVNHYAAPVAYTVGDSGNSPDSAVDNAWIAKNNDSIPDALVSVYASSSVSLFQSFSPAAAAEVPGGAKSGKQPAKRRQSVMMKPTIVEIFSKSMRDLNFVLNESNCHFIRCVKPNPQMTPSLFDNVYVVEQVRALGILQACEVLSVGLPTRIPYSELKSALAGTIGRIQRLLSTSAMSHDNALLSNDVLLISSLLKAYDIPIESYRLGATIAFFKPGQLATLELIFNQELSADREAQIVQSVQSIFEQYTQVMSAIEHGRAELKIASEFADVLGQRLERLRDSVLSLPEVQGLDIPDDIANQLAATEQQLDKTRAQHNDAMRQKLAVENLLHEKDIDLARDSSRIGNRLNVQAIEEFFQCFLKIEECSSSMSAAQSTLQQSISELEESQSATSKVDELRELVDGNEVIFEEVMDRVNQSEKCSVEVSIFAERGNADGAYQAFEAMNHELSLLQSQSSSLSKLIQRGGELLKSLEDVTVCVSFDEIQAKIVVMNAIYSDLQSFFHRFHQLLNSFLSSLEGFSHHVEPAPITAPIAPADLSAPKTAADKTRSPSIQYSVKDLAAIRKRNSITRQSLAVATEAGGASAGGGASDVLTEVVSKKPFASSPLPLLSPNKTSVSTVSPTGLPPNWKEMIDPKTNRPYYVNRITKERTWKKPVAETTQTASSSSASPAPAPIPRPANLTVKPVSGSSSPPSSSDLPAGWRKVMDKKSGRAYYVNDETKVRQWRKPEPELSTTQRPLSIKESSIENIDRRSSRRLSTRGLYSPIKDGNGANGDNELLLARELFNKIDLVVETVHHARRIQNMITNEELMADEELDESVKETVSYMVRIGHRCKAGYLMKQSKLLGRWRKRFVVLDKDMLSYYDSEKDYLSKSSGGKGFKPEKLLTLVGTSQTSYTTTDRCLSVCNPDSAETDDGSSWYLLADNDRDCDDWMQALNAHIHVQYVKENNLTQRDFWEEGTVAVSIWKVPNSGSQSIQRRPVGIRTLPKVDGPRTGEALYPGDVVEIVQCIGVDNRGRQQNYLRLANDRGWVFEMHPTADYAIMIPAGGQVVEKLIRYSYSADFLESLQIYSTPHCHPDSVVGSLENGMMKSVISPGTTVDGSAEWIIQSSELYSASDTDVDDDTFMMRFVKLRDGRGWVPMFHPVTGGQLLVVVN